MKKQAVISILLCAVMALGGCSSMLERDYTAVTPHSATPAVESDQLTIRVESYQDLVNALMYFITQGRDSGVIRLYNYPYDVEGDLDAACTEVSQEDPLGAYAVEDISFNVTPIVSCYEANIHLTYRRTQEQIAAISPVAGSSAIRAKLREALGQFREELVLRINYFDGDEAYIRELLREAWFSAPLSALDFPSVSVSLYPEDSRQCIVEVLLDYSLEGTTLTHRRDQLQQILEKTPLAQQNLSGDSAVFAARTLLLDSVSFDPRGGGTPYHALVEHRADSLGLALSMSLLCQRQDVSCLTVEGTLHGQPHFWNVLSVQEEGGYRHLDLTRNEEEIDCFFTDAEMTGLGYGWDTADAPPCTETTST